MSKRLILLNLLLLSGCFLLSLSIYRDFIAFREANRTESINGRADEAGQIGSPPSLSYPSKSYPSKIDSLEFKLIADRNLFLESRSLQVLAGPQAIQSAPPLEPKPLLLGVATAGSETRAFVQGGQVQPGQKRTRILRVGDEYQGYRVTQISTSLLELSFTSNDGNITKMVLDFKDQRKGQPRGPAAQSTMAPPSQIITVGSVGPSSAALSSARPAVPASMPVSGPPMRANEYIDGQGRRMARTPFGDTVVSQPSFPVNQLSGQTSAGGTTARSVPNSAQQLQTQTRPAPVPRFPYP